MIPKEELRIGNRYLLNGEVKVINSGYDIDNLPENAMPIILDVDCLNERFEQDSKGKWIIKGTILIWRNSQASEILNEAFGGNQKLRFKNTIIARSDLGYSLLKTRVTHLHELENWLYFFSMEKSEPEIL